MNYIDTERLKKDIASAVEQAQRKTGDIKGMAEEKYEKARQKAMESRERAAQYVRENPEKSVIIAAATGVIIGLGISMAIRGKKGWCKHCRE